MSGTSPPASKPRPGAPPTARVYVVVEGEGTALVNGEAIPLAERDLVVVPSWAELRLAARRRLVLFGFSDKAAQEKLGLWREARG